MCGDYYTNTYLTGGSPRTEMVGNQIEFYLRGTSQPQTGASLVIILMVFLMVAMAYYLDHDRPVATRWSTRVKRRRVGPLMIITWLYIVWSLAPVLIAVRISLNSGRSRSTFQSPSFRWYWEDPASVWKDDTLQTALANTLKLAGAHDADRRAARGGDGDRAAALARPRLARCQQPDAAPAGHAGDRARRVAVPRVHRGLHERAPRVHDAVARSRHVHRLVRGDHRPRAADVDRRPLRGGGARSRRQLDCRRCGSCCCHNSARRSSPA